MSTQQQELAQETLAARTSRRLRGLMGENRISGSALAREIGLTQSAFSRRLIGDGEFSLNEIEAISDVLGVTVGWLLGLDNDEAPRVSREGLGRAVRHQGLEPRTRWFVGRPVVDLAAYRARRGVRWAS